MTDRREDEIQASPHERRVEDAAGRRTPYVQGPTELHGDPGADGDRRGEGGAAAGALAGTAVAGPVGGVVGALAGGTLGTADDDGADVENADVENAQLENSANRGGD